VAARHHAGMRGARGGTGEAAAVLRGAGAGSLDSIARAFRGLRGKAQAPLAGALGGQAEGRRPAEAGQGAVSARLFV